MKPRQPSSILGAWLCIFSIAVAGCQRDTPPADTAKPLNLAHLLSDPALQSLGEKIFFDARLSDPPGQSCATCHDPEAGWTGPDEDINKGGAVYRGAVHSRFGNRKPNASAYATFTPTFHAERDGDEVRFIGGDFWDGRATGWKLGDPAADQAQGPFLNPVEQNFAEPSAVIAAICQSPYGAEFKAVAARIWDIDDICATNPEFAYGIVAIAIAAYEHSPAVNQFSSKYDSYLKGEAQLTDEEIRGLELFNGKAMCSRCHTSAVGPNNEPPLFTDFTYDNIGVPKNPDNPWYHMPAEFNPEGASWVDPGLGGFLRELPQYAMYARQNLGKHRVPTVRNVDRRPHGRFVKAYGHNGYFKSLEEVVHFYNTRDVLPVASAVANPVPGVNCWPPPEVSENVNSEELGNLGLTQDEEAALVAFMKTLSDGYSPA